MPDPARVYERDGKFRPRRQPTPKRKGLTRDADSNAIARIEKLVNDLFLGFMRILEHGIIEKTDLNTTSQNQYQLQLDTAKLIRTAEDILTLTRQMQELWLQGHLKPLQQDQRDEQVETDAKAVAEMLDMLIKRRDGMLPQRETDTASAMEM